MTVPFCARERRSVPLDLIIGRSPFNCRAETSDDDIEALAASIEAIGLIHPLLVSTVPGPLLKFWVDDGGRRLAALRKLVADGKIGSKQPIDCDVLVENESVSREISLAANIMRRDLHPVDQCAAFEAMTTAGLSIERIASDFAITTRQVKQRLRLTSLSPRVRAAWRDGTLSTEAAQAMTAGATHEAQDSLLAKAIGCATETWILKTPTEIRRRLLGKIVRTDSAEARYVGLATYIAAGGSVDENLFDEDALIADPALLGRLSREKMMAEGARILEETGYGFCMLLDDVEKEWTWPRIKGDYIPSEVEELAAIEHAAEGGGPEEPAAFQTWERDLELREAAIHARAVDRAATPAMRAQAGIFLNLSAHGLLAIERGVRRPVLDTTPSSDDRTSSSTRPPSPVPAQKPADPIDAAGSGRGMVRTILEATIHKAIADIVGRRPDLALLYMVARYGGTYAPDYLAREVGLEPLKGVRSPGLLAALESRSFDAAIALCVDAPLADLTTAFCQIVGASIRITNKALLITFDPLMRALARRGAPLRTAFVAAIDYDLYFEAATRHGCLAALEAMATDCVDRQAKKPLLAALAADQARKIEWLPYPLAGWAAVEASSPEAQPVDDTGEMAPVQPLAEAMADAIDADEARVRALDSYLASNTRRGDGLKIKAGDLFQHYAATVADPLSLIAFGTAIAERGIGKHRYAAGIHYLGIERVGSVECV